jgi:hypothetical protein
MRALLATRSDARRRPPSLHARAEPIALQRGSSCLVQVEKRRETVFCLFVFLLMLFSPRAFKIQDRLKHDVGTKRVVNRLCISPMDLLSRMKIVMQHVKK